MSIKPPLAPFARRAPQGVLHLRLMERMLAWWKRRFFPARNMRYSELALELSDKTPINDISMAIPCRAVLERRPRRIVEIGTYDGRRIATLKRLFPQAECVGLDIQASFAEPRQAFGVAFRKFDLNEISKLDGTSLVVSIGTMTCMPPAELEAFLKALQPTGAALVFLELTPGYRHGETLIRNANTYFHDYDVILPALGFTLLGGTDTGRSGHLDLNEFDLRYANVAVASSAAE
jgi:hypothetical protein